MSFITRCPACHTAFKVVHDQLKISDGWVRCGQCQHIFDATLDLEPWWPGLEQVPGGVAAQRPEGQTVQRAAQPAQPEPAAPQQQASPSDPPAPAERAVAAAAQAPPPDPAAPRPAAEPGPPEAWAHGAVAAVWRTPAKPEPELSLPPEPATPASLVDAPDMAVGPPEPVGWADAPGEAQALAAADAPIAPTPSFVRQAQRRAWWQRPAVRLVLGLCCLLLALGLALQAAQRWHVALARQLPAAQPVLLSLCQTLECAPPELDAASHVVIDSTVLLRRAPGRYSFQVLLRNRSAFEVPSPAIELTLTDIHDQVLVRRVLLPQDWPRPRATLAPGTEWSLQFELGFDGVADRVMTGYRAILFYP